MKRATIILALVLIAMSAFVSGSCSCSKDKPSDTVNNLCKLIDAYADTIVGGNSPDDMSARAEAYSVHFEQYSSSSEALTEADRDALTNAIVDAVVRAGCRYAELADSPATADDIKTMQEEAKKMASEMVDKAATVGDVVRAIND